MGDKTSTRVIESEISVSGMVSSSSAIMIAQVANDEGHFISATGSSKKDNEDKFDFAVGQNLALARALEALAGKLRKKIGVFE